MAKRSPSGMHLPIIDQRYDQDTSLTLVAGGSVTLPKSVMTYIIVEGLNLAGSTTILLPANPDDGDEVVIASRVTFVDPLTQFFLVDGNGHNYFQFPLSSLTSSGFFWAKFSKEKNTWVLLSCCVFVPIG